MTSTAPPAVRRVDPAEFDWGAGTGAAAEVHAVIASATAEDDRCPVNEAVLLSLEHHGLERAALWTTDGGFALAFVADSHPGPAVEANLVVTPSARRTGRGRALAEAALAELGPATVTAWAHGNHPGAAALAEALAFTRVRDLWVMRRPLAPGLAPDLPPVRVPDGVRVRAFEPGRDEDALLEVNAAAFATHPEQGSLDRAGLAQRTSSTWFDPEGLFLAESTETGHLLGFHWTKTHPADGDTPAHGEVYVVGVHPEAQGLGLGKVLTLAGLHHLRDRGLGEVVLYVEADNDAAVAVYRALGFTHADADTDVMYARS